MKKLTLRTVQKFGLYSLLIFYISCSSKSSNRSTQSDDGTPGGTVTVSGTTSDEKPSDFVQAGESVQIGGTNLLEGTQQTLIVYRITADGETEYSRQTFTAPNFKLTLVGSNYYRLVVQESSLAGVVQPYFPKSGTTGSANVVLTKATTVASKLLSIVSTKASAGDDTAKKVLKSYLLASSDLIALGAAVTQVNARSGTSAIDLTKLSAALSLETIGKVSTLSSQGTGEVAYAKTVSTAQFETLFGTNTSGYSPSILAFKTSTVGDDAALKATRKYYVDNSNKTLIAQYAANASVYRVEADPASTASAAKVNTNYDAFITQDPDSYKVPTPTQQTIEPTTTTSSSSTSSSSSGGGGTTSPVIYTSGSGTFTVPAGVTSLTIEVWGGGGSGGHGDYGGSNVGGSGGGGGGYTIKNNVAVTPGQTLSYTVGAGGATTTFTVACLNGNPGGASNVAGPGTFIANGGNGGGSCGNTGLGTGGTASGGDTNLTGANGSDNPANNGGAGGAGANGGAGGIADLLMDDLNPGVGSAPGGAGAGGHKSSTGDPGAAGAAGQVKFKW